MQSQSYERHFPLASGGVPSAAARTIPSALYWLVALTVGSSFYVALEPAPTDLLFLLLFAVVLFKKGVRFPLDLNPVLTIGLFGFFAGSVLSLIASEIGVSAAFYLAVTAYLLMAWYMVVTLLANYGTPMWELIQRAFLVAAVLGALIGMISHFSTVLQDYLGVQGSYGDRARGAFKDPNVYAPFLCAALLLVINRMVTRRFLSVLSILLLCLFSLEILAAFSRGAYVNLAVSLFVYFALLVFVISRRDWMARSLVLIVIGSIFAVAAAVVFLRASGLEDYLYGRMSLQSYDDKRFSTQALAIDTLVETPFGLGPGQSEIAFDFSPHNLYIRIAIENGLFSALCFLMFVTTTVWIALRGASRRGPYQDAYACCVAILIGILVNSLVIDSLHWRHFFLFLAIPIGLARYERWRARAVVSSADALTRS